MKENQFKEAFPSMKKGVIYIAVVLIQVAILLLLYRWYNKPAPAAAGTAQPPAGQTASSVPTPGSPPATTPLPGGGAAPGQRAEAGIGPGAVGANIPPPPVSGPATLKLDFSNAARGDIKGIALSKECRAGILVNADTGKVLWSKNAEKSVPIASMTKMMTALLTMEAIATKRASLDDVIQVSAACEAVTGGEVWLDKRESFTLDQMIMTFMIKSANDAAFLVAEHIGKGDANAFVQRMNQRAKELGMGDTYFGNPHGLPEKKNGNPDNRATPAGMAMLANELLKYPVIMKYSSTIVANLPRSVGKVKNTVLSSTNYLVRGGEPGVDGLKTGFTNDSGFCVTITCKRNGVRLIAVGTGFKVRKTRTEFMRQLLNWGYKQLGGPSASSKPAVSGKG